MTTGSPFSIASQLLRGAASIQDGEPDAVQRQKLRARVARLMGGSPELGRICDFLGELVGIPADQPSVQLRTAQRDPTLMADQIRRAWEDWVAAEVESYPVLVIIEDLHWGDLPSVKLIDAMLRRAKSLPLMVLAVARPEIAEVFPRLWSDRGLHEVRLSDLSRKAADKLVRAALGEVTPEVAARASSIGLPETPSSSRSSSARSRRATWRSCPRRCWRWSRPGWRPWRPMPGGSCGLPASTDRPSGRAG